MTPFVRTRSFRPPAVTTAAWPVPRRGAGSSGAPSTSGRVAIHQELVEQFIASFARAPRELVLDFDATDDPVHGHQPGAFFHGYYDSYCFVPLYLLLRSAVAGGLPSLFEPGWCEARLGDFVVVGSRGCVGHGLRFASCFGGLGVLPTPDSERHDVGYLVGLARNPVLEREAAVACEVARDGFEATGTKSRSFDDFKSCGADLETSPAGHRPHRTHREGMQPALHRHQP